MSFAALATSIGGLAASTLGLEAGGLAATMIGGAGAGAIGGAGIGGLTSAITGQDIGKGMLMGGLGGALTGGLGSAIGGGAGTAAEEAAQTTAEGAKAAVTPVASGGAELGSTAEMISPMTPGPMAGAPAAFPAGAGLPGGAAMPATMTAPVGMGVVGAAPAATAATAPAASSLFAAHPMMTIGAGAALGALAGGSGKPTQATPPADNYNPLGGFQTNFSQFRDQPAGYTGYLRGQKQYAAGGIASLTDPDQGMSNVDYMGQDAYPMSQQKLNFYSTPSQMPTSAQQAMASYEPATNPLTGEPVAHFDRGGIAQLAVGGKLVRGAGDGMSDDIPANIAGKQEARLADGEFVVPADVVSHLGNGSTDAGAKHLYRMMDNVRKARTGRKSQGKKINAQRHLPA